MVTRKALDSLAAYDDDASPPIEQSKLTQRELQILLEVVAGASNKEIALHSNLSLDTVKSHLKNIYAKLGVRSRSQAIMVAIEQKLISMPV